MRGRRRMIVRGLAAAIVLMAPSPRLWAQAPESATPSPAPPIEGPKEAPTPPPTRPEPDPNPLPPALPAKEPAEAATPPGAYTPEGTFADPEGAAKAFVDRSQKEADEAIAALSKEAEALRARLNKVEAGLARWQAVKESLVSTAAHRPAWRGRAVDGNVIVPGPVVGPGPGDNPPTILEPISPAGPTGRPRPRALDPTAPPPEIPSSPRPAVSDGESKPAPAAVKPASPAPDDAAPQPKGVVHAPKTTRRIE